MITGSQDITYVDYAVARTFFTAVDEWFQSLKLVTRGSGLKFLHSISDHFVFCFRFLSVLIFLIFCYLNFFGIISLDKNESDLLFKASIITFGGSFILFIVSTKIGVLCDEFLSETFPSSYLKINRGDEDAISNLRSKNRRGILSAIFSFLVLVASNVGAIYVVSLMDM